MNFNLGLTFSGVVYTLLIIIIYFKNKRIKTRENKIYSLLLVSTFLELLLGLFGYFSIINISNIPYVTRIINVFSFWTSSFFLSYKPIINTQKIKFKYFRHIF